MLLPFVGILVSFALWGTFFPVPMLSHPSLSFVRRISGAMHATTLAKGVYDLAEMISAFTKPGHEGAVDLPGVVPDDSVLERVVFPSTTVTALSVVVPLWEEADEPTCPAGSGPASTSPVSSCGVVLVLAGALVVVRSLLARVYTLGEALKELCGLLECAPKAAHRLVVVVEPALIERLGATIEESQHSCLVYADSDSGAPTSSETVERDVFCFGRWYRVEAIIVPLVLPRWLGASLELEPCTRGGRTAIPDGADESLTEPAPGASDVSGSSSSARLSREWALVVRGPESPSPVLVYQFLCALLTSWERQSALVAAPVSADQQADEEKGHGAEVATTSGGRRKRPSQAKRRRAARRALMEKQGELIAEFERTTANLPASPAAGAPPAPPTVLGPAVAPPAPPSYGPRHGHPGPRPAPAPPGASAPPYGQYAPYIPPDGPYRRYYY